MNKNKIHNSRETRIKTLFKAPEWSLQAFSSVFVLFSASAIAILLLAASFLFDVGSVESKPILGEHFGIEETTNIFPTKIRAKSWGNVEGVLAQDLADYALYQQFTKGNSAFVGEDVVSAVGITDEYVEVDAQLPTSEAQAESGEGSTASVDNGENPDAAAGAGGDEQDIEAGTQTDSVEQADPQVLEEAEEPSEEVSAPVSFGTVPSFQVLRTATSLFPLAQLTLVSSTEALPPYVAETTPAVEVAPEESVASSESQVPAPELSGTHEITLSNFNIDELQRGHFVDGMQLRVSFAARLKNSATGTLPFVDVLFGKNGEYQSVGSILITDEVSNAVNGGYYLFALPSFVPVEELPEFEVMFRFHGDGENLEGMYLDSAWLEMNTRVVTKEDLLKRGLAEVLTHLEAPKLSELLSEKLNFAQAEDPVFNLRYESQQNFLIRGFMKLIGRGSFKVENVTVSHKASGDIVPNPDVTVTEDNLITVALESGELEEMRPGVYTVNVLVEENGFEYWDSFDFQWGILTINPNKTGYQSGETAKVFMGALSPNGNTLCEAELHLYITDPDGFVSKAPVTPSGACKGNNVTDVPDYAAEFVTGVAGTYEMYLERLDETGAVIGFTTDTFKVAEQQSISIERNGPTRIFPPASYPMQLTVHSDSSFSGTLIERVPADFVISSTTADISQDGDWQVLTWDISIMGEGSETVSYGFDAPDISPYLYNLGPAKIETDEQTRPSAVEEVVTEVSSSTAFVSALPAESTSASSTSDTVEEEIVTGSVVFEEHRQWQIASDATGSMILMWDGATIPTGWTCISCTAGDQFYQRYIIGSSTPGIAGGAATHTHTASGAVVANGSGGVSTTGGGGADSATVAHTHNTYTPAIGTANNLPSYRNLVVIQNNSAGEPISIPAGAIAVFDATVPSGWTQYSAQNGYYVRGESTANRGLTGGSNTHTHTIGGTTSGPTGTTNAPGNSGVSVATNAHTHTISSNTAAENSEPPYLQAILGKLTATSTMPNDVITMWSDTAPTDWNAVSTTSTAFSSKFLKAGATYGTTGGASVHTPANVNGITSGPASAAANRTAGGTGDAPGAHTHTVNVTAFTSGNILPQYRSTIFAKRAGGQPPSAPTVHELFDNEKTGSSTPEFEFTANDPVGTDTLEYQFQWDDDSDVATSPIGDRSSSNETGCSPNCFTNTVSGGDTHPFNDNERIRFSIQSALSDGTTYYWRVRAKKTNGTTWSSWSEVYSFTYVSDTDPSQWMQTTDDQFSKGTLFDAEVFGSNSVRIQQDIPTEALVAYGEGAITTPRYRIWNGSAWSAEQDAADVGGVIQWVRVKPATTRDEYILGTHDANNDVNVQIYDGVADTWGDLLEATATANDTTRRAFDVAYETTSGDALVVYCSGTDAAYRVWNGTSWVGPTTITTASTNNCQYISLASDPTSDEIIMVTRDTVAGTTDYEAIVWNGSAWTTNVTLGSMATGNNEGMTVEYEESGGQAIVVAANGANNSFLWSAWNGIEWSTPLPHAVGNDFQWGILKRDVGSDNMALCYVDTDNDIGIARWDSEAWITAQEFETGGYTDAGRGISCEYEITSGRDGYLMIPYSDTTNSRYRDWTGSVLNGESSISTITEAWEIGSTRTGDGNILAYFHDSVNTNYDFSYWNGTIWSGVQTLETSASVTVDPRRQPIGITAQIFVPSEGTLITDPVPFTSVPNRPTWGEVTWNTTEPNGTDVKIQVLYATTTYCNVPVPDGALPGNSAGFDVDDVPLNISGLSTSTYSSLCLKATLTSGNSSTPTLDDWIISWERQPYLVQTSYRWYANANWINPSDAWPAGATDLLQNESIPQDYSPGSGDVLRLRMSVRSDNAPLEDSTQAFRLQYTEQSGVCASSTAWYDVGAVGSTTALWRGHNNLLALDGATISTLLLTGTDVGGTYEEENDSDVNPNTVSVGNEAEYDWVLEHNGAADGVQYCFRMVDDDGQVLNEYTNYPALITNTSPTAPTLEKVFDNEQVASTSPWFEFVTTDPESEDITYQIQIDDTYDFSSTVLDRNSLTNLSEFENIVTPADKDPFTNGQTVRFKPTSALTNGTTYYWRVRGKDVSGSNEYGDWSEVHSFTVNTATTITTWYQTEQEQFDSNELVSTETTVSDDVVLSSGQTTGTTTGTAIDYDDKTTGNAWGSLSWNHNVTTGSLRYRIEYFTDGEWVLVPDTFLPGNATGFTSSPVSLLGLDPEVHNEIRVRANFTDVSGSPRLLDWKIEWGFAVEQPTQIALFDNEKTGTTTPTFTFTTTDPEGDDIQYQLAYSTDSTFTSSTTVTSGVSAGFTNVTTGIDTSPYFSGDTISWKVQTPLTNNTTYWWRVRGRDPSGGNAWSVWSQPRSFTVDTAVSVSTWFQTTDQQFDTDTLNDTETTGSGGAEITSIIREAFVAYAEGTVQTPRYRLWNGVTWGAEQSGVSVGGAIRFVESAAAPTRDEYMIVTQESTGRVRAQVYDGSTDTAGDLQTIISAVPSATRRGFDVAYETTSGDALVVSCDTTTEASYYVWNGSTWTGPTALTLGTTGTCNHIQLASDPASDEIILVARDDIAGATDYQAQVWNGSGWGNATTFGSGSEAANEGITIEYEESGDRAVVVVPNGITAGFTWNAWSGSAWNGAAATVALQDDFENGRLARDLGSDNMVLCSIDNDGQIAYLRWNGTTNAWTTPYTTVDTVGNSKVGRPFACQYETTSGRDGYIMMPYTDTTNARYRVFDGSTFPAEASISTILDAFEVRSVRTGDGSILAMFYDDDTNTQYDFSYWNGTAWSTIETLESSAITTTNPPTVPFDIVARRYPTFTEGSVVSTPIDFDDGSGLKWQRATFSDTRPGSSVISYQVEYLNGDTWEPVPDSALSGNAAGFTTSPIDLSQVSRLTYNTIRLKANLECISGNCPTLNDWTVEWSEGIVVSGTIRQYNQTASTTSGTVAVAVNGTLQAGKTAVISSNGTWSIPNVRVFEGDIVTVFVTGAVNAAEAVGVTRYDGDGDITNMSMFERHLSLGSNDATTTALTNADIGLYDFTTTEDIFFNVNGTTLSMCADSGCADAELYIRSGVYYTPGGRFVTHDFENNGTFTAGSYTHEVNGSWDNNATTTMTGSTIVFAATSTTESVDGTGAISPSFNNVTFGTTTGNGTWSIPTTLDVNGNLTVSRGTLSRGTTQISIAGNLSNEANGVWTGLGTTTFDGNTSATWRDQNGTLQNVGKVVVDGTSKLVTLASNVAAQSILIGANDTLDASGTNFDITVYGNWTNQNNFVARSGEVFFAATSTGKTITTAGDAFYDLSFSGSGGGWSFTESTVSIGNDLRSTAGTVTLPTATTTIAGSVAVTTGTFQHNNGVMYFTSGSAETIQLSGSGFTNVAYNMTFQGAGNWTVSDINATSTNDVRVLQGTLNFPGGTFAIGGTLIDGGGAYNGGTGVVRFYSGSSEVLTAGGSSFNTVVFQGAGSWSFTDTNVTVNDNLWVNQGTLNLPSGTLSIAGSYDNNATVVPGTGTVLFNSNDTGETVEFGASSLYNVWFNHSSGGWTFTGTATSTNNLSITAANTFVVNSGQTLAVGGVFTNSVGGAATTWTGSILSLYGGSYSLNAKANTGDVYATLRVGGSTDIKMWNSSATSYNIISGGSLYSQDHNAVDGDLYVFGAYERTSGNEYWSAATDFDGTALGAAARQVDVRFASGASAAFTGATVSIVGTSTASTTIANQGSGTYTVTARGGSFTANYYQFADLGGAGLSLLGAVAVPSLEDGSFTVGAPGASAITLSSTTIDASPSKQISSVHFATSTAIAAYNVSQTDGTPTSFWWFKEGTGNLYGEAKDNDTGNPGSVRFDDSSLVITVSGTVYSDGGTTPLVGGTCDGSTQVVRVVVNGGTSYTGSCSNVDGTYSVSGVTFSGDPTLTIYLDNASGGQRGSVITRTPTGDISNMDIYANRVIVRNEDVDALTNANLSVYDADNDTDLRYVANAGALTVLSGNELFVWTGDTFTPGGVVTLAANAGSNSYDGTLYIDNSATFNAYATSTLTIGGRLVLDPSATFSAASTTVLMNATTSGKSITASGPVTFNHLTFNGAGGSWNLGANITVNGNMTITAGTVTGTGNISLPYGSLTGNGVLSLGAGTTTISRTNTLGGTSAWTFYNLQLGSGSVVGTTTPVSAATTTISGRLTIAAAHFLDAGSSLWDLAGTGTVFVENGTFLEDTSTVRYSGNGSVVRSTNYYNLDINAGAGSPTYTTGATGIIVLGNLTVGGTSNTTFNLTTADPAFDVNGNVTIRSNGTLSASDSGLFTIGGSYDNNGTFTGNGGTVTFDTAGSATIAAGSSSFSNVRFIATGSLTVSEHATATANVTLRNASSFTLASGQLLAVGGTFFNALGGGATTWTGSTLRLFSNTNYSLNAATTTDTYATISVDGTTQARMWNSDAAAYDVDATASLYSQDHANNAGDLYIWGSYRRTSGADHWSYATDFDGTALGGSSRKVDVFMASGASVTVSGGTLAVYGAGSASTTIQNQGSGTYALTVGGSASTSFQYYEVTDINSAGLTLTGAPTIGTLSNGNLEVSQNGGTAMTVGGTVITANPARNFNRNRFVLNGVGSGNNVTATGTTVSAWRFANHYGDIDGEVFDVDPNGDPGYIGWDDSTALITVAGRVYADEGTTASAACDGVTNNVTLRVAGITSYSTSCNASTGQYTINNVSYGSADSLVVYIDGETEKGTTVTQDPISNINDLHIYENRVIVRHESTDALTIDDMAVWDSSDDADIQFTAVSGSPDTLTLPANRKLIVWGAKTFAPGGNVTVSGGGGGAAYDGTIELFANADWTGAGSESLSVGGSLILNAGAGFATANGTTTFTTTGSGRTIDLNESALHNVNFTGSGSWTVTDTTFTTNGHFNMTAGTLDLPTGTTTISGSMVNNGGTIDANGGLVRLIGTGARTLRMGGSSLATLTFAGGNYTITDTNATTTASTTIASGTITLPSGTFAVGGDFENQGGAITHNSGRLALTSASGANLLASSSNLYTIVFRGGGSYTMEDRGITFADDFHITNGSDVLLASGTISVGGSLNATGGTFTNATTTFLFNSTDAGETINPGVNDFYSVQIGAPTGGYTLTGSATTTHNFTIASVASFATQSGVVLRVENVFTNSVGGTNTSWLGSTLVLAGQSTYTINTKSTGADRYNIFSIAPNTDIRMWNSSATTTSLHNTASLYSMDHNASNGALNIYGDFHVASSTEYWSYATDFDGASLAGIERAVTVSLAANATTTVDSGTLNIIGSAGNETTIQNQGSDTYAFTVAGGTFNAQRYEFRNLNATGLNLTGTPTISSLSYGDFELAVNTGSLITVASSTLNANASMVIVGNRFATTTAITGKNVTLNGETSNAWTFVTHTGNLDGEAYDTDGVTACGSIRWSDSSCLITQQTHYRWRNDDGGVGVPNSEWYNSNWDGRKAVHIDNADATTYTDAVVQVFVDYDSDMQADFDDLRFTQDNGTTLIPYWIGSTTDSDLAEVWLKLPSLPAEDSATVYMYYNNPTATSSSSAEDTFIAADDFEDGDFTEYSGQTSLFAVDGSFAFDGAYGLDNTGDESSRATAGGIYRLDQVVSQGETFRFMQYIDTSAGSGDEVCTKFGVQNPGSANDNYAVCVEQFGTDRLTLVKDAVENDTSAGSTILASSTVSYSTGWYEIEVVWETDDDITVRLYNAAGTLVTSIADNDTSYTSGGIGFSYWFHNGGWDSVSSRPTLATEPTIRFGAEQTDGGATWKAAQNTEGVYDIGDVARLRIALENSGLDITGQQLLLEYAELGSAPSCEAVPTNDFATVPTQASCGTSPVCMQSSSFVTNGATIADLLADTETTFFTGQVREDPSNITSSIDIDESNYVEVEYAITPTSNVSDENICFRVTNNGTEYDTYLRVARMTLQFNPIVDTVTFNEGLDIALVPGTTTRVYATTTVTDLNGVDDLAYATSTIYRSGATGGASCAPNNNDCYVSQCTFTNCAGNSCVASCYADMYFHADPTGVGGLYEGEVWYAFIEVEDFAGGYDFDTSPYQEVDALRAIDVNQGISYGALEVSQDTGSTNASTTVENQGNVEIDLEVVGTDMTDGGTSAIPASQQRFSTSTFTYSGCTSCVSLSSTTPFELDVELSKPTSVAPPVTDAVYWGIAVPFGVNSAPHQGVNVFTPISP